MIQLENPFNVTKAVDFSNEEIIKYWVDLPDERGFRSFIKPESKMPILILGGKGSGKTHIMRYSSYELQKIRSNDNLLQLLQDEGYIGIYHRGSGLNSHRFNGKGQTDDFWIGIFSYYMELWLAEMLLNTIIDIIDIAKIKFDQKKICKAILSLMDKTGPLENISDIVLIREAIKDLRKNVDLMTNNIAISDDIEKPEILVSPKQFVCGIPDVIRDNVDELNSITFIYLLDEMENITKSQQKYYQTLIRERSGCSTFRIGARLSGIKTKMTLAGGEENKQGSEYELIILDEYFKKNKDAYKHFAYSICSKRLSDIIDFDNSRIDSDEIMSKYFEQIDEEKYCKELVSRFDKIGKKRPYFEHLIKNIRFLSEQKIENIIENLSSYDDPIIEMVNIMLLYREWAKGNYDLLTVSSNVRKEMLKYYAKDDNCDQSRVLSKFKSDIIAKIKYECGGDYFYSGLGSLIDMSDGIPRLFLNILKHIYRWSAFSNEAPFAGGIISAKSQKKGINDAMTWFLNDAYIQDKDIGSKMKNSLYHLAQYLRDIRYSDVPPECSLVAISVNDADISQEISDIIDALKENSFLIETKKRKERNTKRYDRVFEVVGILATNWDLPLSKRGDLKIDEGEVRAIFCEIQNEYNKNILENRISRYMAPFSKTSANRFNENQQTLF
jgi:hypothetical protein